MTTLSRAGREYVTWTIEGVPDGATLDVSIDDGETWHPLERDGADHRALIAGPDAADNPPGTIVLPTDAIRPRIRLVDTPEVIIRSSGRIYVTETPR